MKRFLITLMLMTGLIVCGFAQKLTYQSVVRDNAQQLVANTDVTTQLTIHFSDGSRYDTTINATTNIHGLLSLEFGNDIFYTKNWQDATLSVVVSNRAMSSLVYINSLNRPVDAAPYALTVNGNSIQNYLDKHHYIDITQVRTVISDTAIVLRQQIATAGQVSDCNDVINCVNNELSLDTTALNHAIDTIVSNGITKYMDTASHFVTTLNNYVDTSDYYVNTVEDIVTGNDSVYNQIAQQVMDTLANRYSAQDLCDSVASCISTTVNNIIDTSSHISSRLDNYVDTAAHFIQTVNNIIDTSSSIINNINRYLQDSTANLTNAINNYIDSSKYFVNTLETIVDSSSSIHNQIGGQIKDTLSKYYNAQALCDSVSNCIQNTVNSIIDSSSHMSNRISNYLSTNNYITESNLDNRHYLTSDSTVITNMLDSITQLKSGTTGNITTANLCSSIESLCTNVALENADNTFSGDNSFTNNTTIGGTGSTTTFNGTVNVPSGYTLGTTNSTNCTQDAVNACDLAAVFDSIKAQLDDFEDLINKVSDTLNELRAAKLPTYQNMPGTITSNKLDVTANFLDGGADITDYKFCIADNSSMTGAICSNGASNGHVFVGLTPATKYYIKAEATNLKGTGKSPAVLFTTPADKPTAGALTLTSTDTAGFTVTVPNITTGGADSAQVRVCYAQGDDCSATLSYTCTPVQNVAAGTFTKTITKLQPYKKYCVKVEISTNNGDSSITVGPNNVQTPAVTPDLAATVDTASTNTTIIVNGKLQTLGGPASANVKVCAYKNADYSDTPKCSTDTTMAAPGNFNRKITGLDTNTRYHLLVISDNGFKKDTVKATATTMKVMLTLTPDSTGYFYTCGADTSITYTATLTGDDSHLSSYTYAWKIDGRDTTATGNTLKVKYRNVAATYKIKCVATRNADFTFADSVTTKMAIDKIPAFVLCSDCEAGKVFIKTATNVDTATWLNASNVKVYDYKAVNSYALPSGTYSVVATNNTSKCSVTYTGITVDRTPTYCTISVLKSNESGTGTRLDSVADHEGNWYRVVEIGTGANKQCWLAENMRATTEPTATSTSIVQTTASSVSVSGPIAYHYNNSTTYSDKYGLLYNFSAAMNINDQSITFTYPHRGICPEGWHIPQESEWDIMATAAGCTAAYGTGTGAGKLTGECDWPTSSNTTAPGNYAYSERNSSGLSILPGGYYYSNFYEGGSASGIWSSTPVDATYAYHRSFTSALEYVYRDYSIRDYAFSVRCVREEPGLTLGTITSTPTNVSLAITAPYTATKAVTGATICAYTNAACTIPAGNCATNVTYSATPITGTITGLTANTNYYVKVIATTAGGSVEKIAGPFKTTNASISIAASPTGTVKLCPSSTVSVTYTATVTGGTPSAYQWNVTGGTGSSTTNSITVTTSLTGTISVTCTAMGASASKSTIVQAGTAPTLSLCEDCVFGSIVVNSTTATSITWQLGSNTPVSSTSGISIGTSTPAGTYTVVASNGTCSITTSAQLSTTSTSCDGLTSMSDGYGNTYKVVKIGGKCWMAENMRSTKLNSGTSVIENPASTKSTSKAKAFYYGNNSANASTYGLLYNFKAANSVCPSGWHLPTKDEWTTMLSAAGVGYGSSGDGLGKLAGSCKWNSGGSGACPGNYSYSSRNSSGFSMLPGGRSNDNSTPGFTDLNGYANFWSSTSAGSNQHWAAWCGNTQTYMSITETLDHRALSVRCVKD